MHDEIAEVEQDPLALVNTFSADRLDRALFTKPVLDLIGDGTNLDVGVAGADHEVVGHDEQLRHLDGDDVDRLLVARRIGGDQRELLARVHCAPSPCAGVALKSLPTITITSVTSPVEGSELTSPTPSAALTASPCAAVPRRTMTLVLS